MDYEDFIDEVEELSFIQDRETADAAVKAVLGILVSHIDEDLARRIVRGLPEPLTMEKLRGHQARVIPISVEEFVAEIRAMFSLDSEQARSLIDSVLHVAKEALGDGALNEVRDRLTGDWADVLVNA